MKTYKVELELLGPVSTPFHSGTLFGHLCWRLREKEGEKALKQFLEELAEAPFLVSDAFPAGYLPRPLLPPQRGRPASRGPLTKITVHELDKIKKVRKRSWIRAEDFLDIRDRLSESALLERITGDGEGPGKLDEYRTAHNTINRLTGTTPPYGGLYFMDELWPREEPDAHWDVYVRCRQEASWLDEIFGLVGEYGYGKDASLGRGCFRATVSEADARLFEHRGNRLMSLSHGSLTGNMHEPRYRLATHYGKLGGERAVTGKQVDGETMLAPFKYPLSLLKPGATFAPGGEGPFGELLRGVHNIYKDVVHNAWHLTIPYTEVGDE